MSELTEIPDVPVGRHACEACHVPLVEAHAVAPRLWATARWSASASNDLRIDATDHYLCRDCYDDLNEYCASFEYIAVTGTGLITPRRLSRWLQMVGVLA